MAWLTIPSSHLQAQVNVWTYHNDNSRTGANTNETILTPANVNTNSFGKLFSYSVDGYIYAQPLYVANVTVTNKGIHNVVFVGTEGDTVYAFDADSNSGSNANPLWQRNLLGTGESTLNTNDVSVPGNTTSDVTPQIGITGTPVIDVTNGTLYVVAKSKLVSGSTTNFYQRLHALDITSGNERSNSPVLIQATVAGTGEGSSGGQLAFNAIRQHQRSALLLLNGTVYIIWASHGDISPYHGWVMGYDENTLARVSVFNTSPNGWKTGIWQGGNGPAADANGNLFFMTGNGSFDIPTNNDYGDSFVRLTTTNASTNLTVADYFTPYNQYQLGGTPSADSDLGSGGPLLLPDAVGSATHKHLVVGAGKLGTIYLVDRDNMGHFNNTGGSSDPNIVQELVSALAVPNMSTPTYWNYRLYYLAHKDMVKAFSISNAVLSVTPVDKSATSPNTWFGDTMSISANGNSNGVLWIIDAYKGTVSNAVLHAYNASSLTTELYNSGMAGTRDTGPMGVKFTVPTVANGKVYIGGQSSLVAYGNAAAASPPSIAAQPQGQAVPAGTNLSLVVGVAGTTNFTTRWYFDGTLVPGATATNYTINNIQTTNAGYYYATVSNAVGMDTSAWAYVSVVPPLTNSPGSALAPSGLVDWWPADGNAIDIVGGNNGTPTNALTYGPGESGLAFQFDGITAFLNVGASNLPPPWTACMWVNRQQGLTNASIIMGDGTYYLKLEQFNSTNRVGITQLGFKDSAFNYVVPTNTWTHLAFVATSSAVTLYANGVSQGSITTNNFPLARSYIGTGYASTRFIDYLHGSLDEIQVFNQALSAGEINAIYSAGSAGLVRGPQFTTISQSSNQFTAGMEGMTGRTFTIHASTNLSTWAPVTTLPNPNGTNTYTESVATNNTAKFYRLSQP